MLGVHTINPNYHLHIFSNKEQLGDATANYVAELSAQAINQRGRFTVAISGGSLPKLLGPALVNSPLNTPIAWPAWHVFFADERCVPLTDSESNYRLAAETLFNHVDIPPTQIYPINEALSPAQAAADYQANLHRVFSNATPFPRFDLILLGMGEDGHTASLFPGHPLLNETECWVAEILNSPKPPPERLTLTLPVINNARHVAFVATGAGKADILPQILEDKPLSDTSLPAQRVQPVNGKLHWFVDEAAAVKLTHPGN